jgi:hypothetical protein
MASTDPSRGERRARWAYERARLQRALLGALPVVVLALTAAQVGGMVAPVLSIGFGLFVMATMYLWWGRSLKKAVLPGLAAGSVPLVLALCTTRYSPTVCATSCALGGVLAGSWLGWAASQRGGDRVVFLIGAALVALMTGSMGAICGGYVSAMALLGGYGLGVAGSLVIRFRSDRGPRRSG